MPHFETRSVWQVIITHICTTLSRLRPIEVGRSPPATFLTPSHQSPYFPHLFLILNLHFFRAVVVQMERSMVRTLETACPYYFNFLICEWVLAITLANDEGKHHDESCTWTNENVRSPQSALSQRGGLQSKPSTSWRLCASYNGLRIINALLIRIQCYHHPFLK